MCQSLYRELVEDVVGHSVDAPLIIAGLGTEHFLDIVLVHTAILFAENGHEERIAALVTQHLRRQLPVSAKPSVPCCRREH